MNAEKYRLFRDDLAGEDGNLREWGDESSDEVVALWGLPVDLYEFECVKRTPDDAATTQYYSITGERVVYRTKVLSLATDGVCMSDKEVLSARPFVDAPCTVADLLDKNIKVAMAFVPLTSEDGVSGAVLARLYCISGLNYKTSIPFDSEIPRGAERYSWFLAGCKKKPKPAHESWHLAAGLLMSIMEDDNAQAKRNLASSFIVTGQLNWVTGEVGPVDMGQKTSVVTPELKRMTWIMSIDNRRNLQAEEMKMMKIECPATLDEAYELIKTMQNHATTAMLALLDRPNFAAFDEQIRIGADVQAVRKDLCTRPLQAVAMQIERVSGELGKAADDGPYAKNLRRQLEDLRKMKARLYREGAGAAFLFWNFAKDGRRDMIELLANEYDVNACDECGDSAVDMAIDAGDKNAEALLRSFGVRSGPCHQNTPAVVQAIKELKPAYKKLSDASSRAIMRALDAGLSPETRVTLDSSYLDDHGIPDGSIDDVTLFEALIAHEEFSLVRRCIEQGADVNARRKSRGEWARHPERGTCCQEKVPLAWAGSEEMRNFLFQHGAHVMLSECMSNTI